MVSIDISSLFTNIPLEEVTDIIAERIDAKQNQFPFSGAWAKKIILFCCQYVDFTFDNQVYRHGLTIRSNTGWHFVDLLETRFLMDEITKCFKYLRFVDCTLLIVPAELDIKEMLLKFHKVHKAI